MLTQKVARRTNRRRISGDYFGLQVELQGNQDAPTQIPIRNLTNTVRKTIILEAAYKFTSQEAHKH